jgi:hypothetical protein
MYITEEKIAQKCGLLLHCSKKTAQSKQSPLKREAEAFGA